MALHLRTQTTAGKITLSIFIIGFVVFSLLFLFDLGHQRIAQEANAQSDQATTTVNVLNTPPQWTSDAIEAPASGTTTPTNATSTVTFEAIGTDSNAEDYFLIVCKTSVAPTANSSAPPTCNGGAGNLWALSATTTSGATSTAIYTTLEGDAELNEWFGWICDFNAGLPRCNTAFRQGQDGETELTNTANSPFHVNHRPTFTGYFNNSPIDPNNTLEWYSTSTDADTLSGDTVYLYACSTAEFDYTAPGCLATEYASTTYATTSNAWATTTISAPYQDAVYSASLFLLDNHNFGALWGTNGSSSDFTINNVAPTVAGGTITVNGGADLTLSVEQGETTGFTVEFIVTDNNSCVANGSTTLEFDDAAVNFYRSDILQANCDESSEYNPNYCYTWASGPTVWNYTNATTTSTDSCDGPTDLSASYEFTFPLWYVADPTDGSQASETPHFASNWLASVQAADDDGASSTLSESAAGQEVNRFLSFDLNSLTIDYGSLEPGNTTTPLFATSTVEATGNVGLDLGINGEHMCIGYTTPGSCFYPAPENGTSTIIAEKQVYATSTVAYNSSEAYLLSTSTVELELNVSSSSATSTPATGTPYWGIAIPSTITLSGAYEGQNTLTALTGEATEW